MPEHCFLSWLLLLLLIIQGAFTTSIMTNISEDGSIFTPFRISFWCACGDVAIHGLIMLGLCSIARLLFTIQTYVVRKTRDKCLVTTLGDRGCGSRRCIEQVPSELAIHSAIFFLHLIPVLFTYFLFYALYLSL